MKQTQANEQGFTPVHQTIPNPSTAERLVLKFMILGGAYAVLMFLWWYFQGDHRGHPVLFWLLTFSFAYKLLHLAYEWYYLAAIKKDDWHPPAENLKVDMLTTFVPGEPYEMIENTLRAMTAVQYPHTTYLCDEGDDPHLKKVCADLGVVHVYRGKDKRGAKAGNINYALKHHATGDFCVILDPDHVPVPEFLDRTLPYFKDSQVGYVQCIQAYSNFKDSIIAKSAAQQTYIFYGPLMMGMHGKGTVQAIGANCTFRRKALDSIGGHAYGLCEDMHTAMQLHAKKWKSVYVPESLSWGRTPSSLAAFYKQQLKWSRGAFSLLFQSYPLLFKHFNWTQRIHYFLTPLYFFYGVIGLIDISVPVAALLSFHSPLYVSLPEFFLRLTPIILMMFVIRMYAQRFVYNQHERGFYFWGGILRLSTWWVYLLGFVYSLLRINVPYIPTPKDNQKGSSFLLQVPNLLVILFIVYALQYGLAKDWTPYSLVMAGFSAMVAAILSITVIADQQALWLRIPDSLKRLGSVGYQLRHKYVYQLARSSIVAILVACVGILFASLDWFDIKRAHPPSFLLNKSEHPTAVEWQSEDTTFFHRVYQPGELLNTGRSNFQKSYKGIRYDSFSGKYEWLVDGAPFYMKGIVYNPEESEADRGWPLTRIQLKQDLKKIREMGANTLIRTAGSIYDYNILNAVEESGLKVVLRLWASPEIDYQQEPERARQQLQDLLELVQQYRAHQSVLCWSVRADTWTNLMYQHRQEDLSEVRAAYESWLEELVSEVKKIAPEVPLMMEFSNSYAFSSCWPELQKVDPLIDLLGVTAHHPEQWQALAFTADKFAVQKPHLVLEFGGADLWDTLVSGANDLYWYPEISCFAKARTYSAYWKQIEAQKGVNLGGAAYAWRDRMEASLTMAGLTDYKGRIKPAYAALREMWTGEPQSFPLHDLHLRMNLGFDDGNYFYRFTAQTENTFDTSLDLEWYISNPEQDKPYAFTVNYSKLGDYGFKALRKYHQLLGKGFTPHSRGLETCFLQSSARPFQRIYLHIADDAGHVVTASYPIHPERLIQQIKR